MSNPSRMFKLKILESEKESNDDQLCRLENETMNPDIPYAEEYIELVKEDLSSINEWMDDIAGNKRPKLTPDKLEKRIEVLGNNIKCHHDILTHDDTLSEKDIGDIKENIRLLEIWKGYLEKRDTKKIGRNDPCPCGSGKKYKKCCLNSIDPVPKEIKLTWEEAEMEYGMLQVDGMFPMLGKMDHNTKIEALKEIIHGCPDFYPAIMDHGMQLLTNGKLEGAREDIDKGLKIMKERDVEARIINDTIDNICHNLETYFCYREAIDYYEMIPQLDVDQKSKATAHGDIAHCCYHIGDPDRALEEAEKAVSIAPGHCKSLSNLGWIRLTRGELSAAREVLEKAVEADPDDGYAEGNLDACVLMMDNELKDWTSFLLKDQDHDNIERMREENDNAGLERERITYNRSLLQAFRHELSVDNSRTYHEKYDLFFSLTYALKILDDVSFDDDLYFSDILEVKTSVARFLARLIVKTGDINHEIFDGSINAILEFYRFLESKDVVEGSKDLEAEVEELREEFREKMHAYKKARRSGNPDVKEKVREELFGDLYWSF